MERVSDYLELHQAIVVTRNKDQEMSLGPNPEGRLEYAPQGVDGIVKYAIEATKGSV